MMIWLRHFTCLFIVAVLVFPVSSYGGMEEKVLKEVVVTATRIETPAEEVGSSLTVITAEDIAAKGCTTVTEVLRGTVGVDVAVAGGPGQESSVFLRGAESYQTLVLIDGLELNDPSGRNRGVNFANLTVDNIERIEILRGPQGPLYGADAMGGVINIITKRGEGRPRYFIEGEGGSYGTWRESVGANMGGEKFNVAIEASHRSSEGFSSADDNLPGNSEKDKWENTGASARLGVALSEKVELDFSGRYQDGRTHLDQGGGPNQDAPDYLLDERTMLGRVKADIRAFDGLWEQTVAFGIADHKRAYKDDPWSGDYRYDGKKEEVSWQHNLYIHDAHILTVGLEYEKEGLDDQQTLDVTADTKSVFLQDQITLKGISFTTLGVRYDEHENFGGEATFRVTQAVLLREWCTKIKGSCGTGFRAPSLNELFYINPWGGPGGNPDLNPEESTGWDVGIEQSLLSGNVTMGITYFHNDFKNLIEWKNGYENAENAKTQGVESFFHINPRDDLSVTLTYTYTDTKDRKGTQLRRRPLHKASLSTGWSFRDRGKLNVGVQYVGTRDDSYWNAMTFTTDDVVLDDYIVVNCAGSYDISDHFQLFARVENCFDEKYYDAYGYGVCGFSIYGGVKVSF